MALDAEVRYAIILPFTLIVIVKIVKFSFSLLHLVWIFHCCKSSFYFEIRSNGTSFSSIWGED